MTLRGPDPSDSVQPSPFVAIAELDVIIYDDPINCRTDVVWTVDTRPFQSAMDRLENALSNDTWRDSEGCWADVWNETHHEYLPCDCRPDPTSELGLCTEHEEKLSALREAS